MTNKQLHTRAMLRLTRDNLKWYKSSLTIQEAQATGLLEALYKAEDYFLNIMLNPYKQMELEQKLIKKYEKGTITAKEENLLWDLRVKDDRCGNCGKRRIFRENICNSCYEEDKADDALADPETYN